MKFVVIGGGGFVGSWLTRELLVRKQNVVVIDPFIHFSTWDQKTKKIIEKFKANDLLKGAKVHKKSFEDGGVAILAKENPDVVIHLAGIPLEKATDFDFSLNQLTKDITLTYHVVGAMKKLPDTKFVFMSSIAAYGECDDVITESFPLNPRTPYGMTKALGEYLTQSELTNWNIIRTTNVYGFGDMNGRASNTIINKILKGERFAVNNVIAMDFTYVKDLVKGIADVALKAPKQKIYHISGGKARKLTDFVTILREHYEFDYDLQDVKDRPKRGTMDNTKIKKEIGWSPQTVLESGMKDYLKYVKKYKIA